MKKIIDGKRYDTDTATMIASDQSRHNSSDFHWWEETLYRTPNGNWFLFGEGGAASKYARPCDSGRIGGEDLAPMTTDEAYEWCERHDQIEVIERHFPDRVQDA
ncbi:hypothetical protein [Candidatus Magnetobacterium casense]|uniref:Uncharacterized protein n=1 Tax=Candidatus Magnetobacterium casense TaxID=1455061 RepID=A0ABS6S0C9_9BACT|nr:hypothetical protein [Candidatus Magnetobacterium casensis]MBV6342315.1 hypothetical protein [Candidatus Magnetobacterium casensis]